MRTVRSGVKSSKFHCTVGKHESIKRLSFHLPTLPNMQHPLPVLPRCRGPALPFRVAAHLHPSAAARHARHRVHTHTLHRRPAVQLSPPADRVAPGRGQGLVFQSHRCVQPLILCWHVVKFDSFLCTGASCGPWEQPLAQTGSWTASAVVL